MSKCSITLKPMLEWMKEDDPTVCRPCLLPPVIQWYTGELNEKKHAEQAQQLADIVDNNPDPLTLCEKLDNIKSEVEESLRERLEEFDCAAQAFKPEDDS